MPPCYFRFFPCRGFKACSHLARLMSLRRPAPHANCAYKGALTERMTEFPWTLNNCGPIHSIPCLLYSLVLFEDWYDFIAKLKCMCIYACVCVYVPTGECSCVCMCMSVNLCVHVCMLLCVHALVCVCLCVHTSLCLCVHVPIGKCSCM